MSSTQIHPPRAPYVNGRLKVLYVITLAERGGAQTHVAQLLRGFQDDVDAHLVVGNEGYLTEVARSLDLPVTVLPSLVQPISPRSDFRAFADLQRIVQTVCPDVIHAHSSKAGLLARAVAWRQRLPIVFTAHGWAFTGGAPFSRKALALPLEWLAGRVPRQRIVAVSKYDQSRSERFRVGRRASVRTVHNGLPDAPTVFRRRLDAPPVLTMVARFAQPKQQLDLVNAAAGITEPFVVQLVGSGPEFDRVRTEVRRKNLQDRVHLLGDRADVPDLLARSNVIVLMSRFEGLPISVLEGMRAGLPVIASHVGGIPELVEHGTNGFLVPSGDVAALRVAMLRLIRSPDLRTRMGTASRERFTRQFREDLMLRRIRDTYTAVLDEASEQALG